VLYQLSYVGPSMTNSHTSHLVGRGGFEPP
jgi:hypothetical protein